MSTEKSTTQNSPAKASMENLTDAVKLVNAEIERQRQKLEELVKDEEGLPISLEGNTSEGYYAVLRVSPCKIAAVMLKYDYPIWNALELDAPDAMWDELAEMVGLDGVIGVDISL